MTGWRIGFAAGPRDIISAMEAVQSHSTSNPCSVAQAAAVAALTGDQTLVTNMASGFAQRHTRLVAAINAISGLHCRPAGGAFYLMIDVRGALAHLAQQSREAGNAMPLVADDEGLAHWLLQTHHLALAAGTWFGMPGFLRCSFAASDAVLDTAVARLHRAFA